MASLVDLIVCRLQQNKIILLAVLLMVVTSKKETKVVVEEESLPLYKTAAFEAKWIKKSDPDCVKINANAPTSLHNQLGPIIMGTKTVNKNFGIKKED